MSKEEISLIAQRLWSSKDVWKVLTGIAAAVFVITLIYARFLAMEKQIIVNDEKHAAEIKTLTERIDKQNARLVAADEELEEDIEKELNKIDEELEHLEDDMVMLQIYSHEPGPGQKVIKH